jgi:hypothetical protein
MNVPFSPLWLWPVVIGMVVGAILWQRWQVRAFRAAPAEDWPKHAPKGWKNVRILPWFLAIAGVIGAYSLWRFSAPSVHGIVLNAATGQGIRGAMVARKVFRSAQTSLTEGPGVFTEPWSRVQTHTDSRGRFFLPGYISLFPVGIRGECGMAWKVFAPGYMIAGGCEQKGFPTPDGCGPDGVLSFPDPWITTDSQRRLGSIRLQVRLSRPSAGPGDPWGEYFRRLNVLTQFRYLKREDFMREAVAYVERGLPLSDGIAFQFLELVGAPIIERPIPRDHDRSVLRLRKAILDYCDRASTSDFCRRSAVGVGYIREFFSREGSHAK